MKRNTVFRALLLILFLILILLWYHSKTNIPTVLQPMIREKVEVHIEGFPMDKEDHKQIVGEYFMQRKDWKTSNLGSILFKNISHSVFQNNIRENRTYTILLWKYWDWLKERHVLNFNSSRVISSGTAEHIFQDCSVRNCIVTGNDSTLDTADAVIIHMNKNVIPEVKKRNLEQRWIFLNDESPINTFFMDKTHPHSLSRLNKIFNWTMTYSSESDVPVPYGRTVPLRAPVAVNTSDSSSALAKLVPYWDQKKNSPLAMIIYSHCMPYRKKLIKTLRNYLQLEVFGKCSDKPENKNGCPGYFRVDCMLPINFLFYLVFENSECHQYITEKVFHHAYSKGAIPVILGPLLKDCETLLPPNSYLYVDNYKSTASLAEHMIEISKSTEELLYYHEWRRHFAVVNEHGYFGTRSYHFCRVCEALNYNDPAVKIYDDSDPKANLNLIFDEKKLCQKKQFNLI